MKKLLIAILVVFNLTLVYIAINQHDDTVEHFGQYNPNEYIPSELQQKIDANENIIVVDVRLPDEYAQGHLPNAINIAYDDTEQLASLPKDTEIVVYCTLSMWRAPYAGYTLSQTGHDNVTILSGGAKGWEEEGGVLEASSSDITPRIAEKPANLVPSSPTNPGESEVWIEFNEELLSFYNGKEGRSAYVAYDGTVYDVTESPVWQDGVHRPAFGKGFIEVEAGKDLTTWLTFAPHGAQNLEKFPVVGTFE